MTREQLLEAILSILDEIDYYRNGLHALTTELDLAELSEGALAKIYESAVSTKRLHDRTRDTKHSISIDAKLP